MKHTLRLAGAIGLVLILSPALRAHVWQTGPNSYVAGIPTEEFVYTVAPEMQGRQRQQNWCWAACVQMVLNFHGLYVSQEQVVERIFGRQVNEPATNSQILEALSGWAPDFRGRSSLIRATTYVWDEAVIDDLAHEWPLIVGLDNKDGTGHAYVLTAIEFHNVRYVTDYQQSFWRGRWERIPVYAVRPEIDYLILRDPWPGSQSKTRMPFAEFTSAVMFTDRVHVVRY